MKERKIPGNQRQPQKFDTANQRRDNLSWRTLEQQVVRMQKQITQACQHGDEQAMHLLQQRLMESEAARLLAVHRVTEENQGKHTAGVDGVKSLTSQEQLVMASSIHPSNWSHQPPGPMRRVWIPKPGTAERRPLAILPMIDRCKQALVKLALEPEWEMRFETHSYGYRPGRSAHDAIAAIAVAIERHPCFVFDADIEKAFDHINQTVLLDKLQTYPALRRAIQTWLKAGIMDAGHYVPSETGIAQGGVLSPLLMNVALHGMETVVTGNKAGDQRSEQPLLVRYGDDFVILHADLHELQQTAKRIRQWLATIGLQLNAQKTRITHTLTPYHGQIGFDFLGFSIRQELIEKFLREKHGQERFLRVKTMITPSQETIRRHLATIEQRLQQLQTASQAQVIEELNPLIRGWASYYNGVVEAATMNRYDELLEKRLLQWASKRHPGKMYDWLLARYWQREGSHKRVFATQGGLTLRSYGQTSILRG